MQYGLNLIFISLVVLGLLRTLDNQKEVKWFFISGLLFRILGGLTSGYIYVHHYKMGDPIVIYDFVKNGIDEGLMSFLKLPLGDLSQDPRTMFFSKMIAPIVSIANDFWLTGVYLSIISFTGFWYFAKTLADTFPEIKKLAYLSILFLPSTLIWSSGIMKEVLANPAVFICLAVALKRIESRSLEKYEWVMTILAIVILIHLRFYLAGMVMVILVLAFCQKYIYTVSTWKVAGLTILILIIGFVSMRLMHPWLTLERLPLTIFENHQLIRERSEPNSLIQYQLSPDYLSLIQNFPKAVFTSLFRPYLWENNILLSIPIKIEKMVSIILLILTVINMRRIKSHISIWLSLLFILVLAGFIGLSTPNFGTLSRYVSVLVPITFFMSAVVPYRKYFKTGLQKD